MTTQQTAADAVHQRKKPGPKPKAQKIKHDPEMQTIAPQTGVSAYARQQKGGGALSTSDDFYSADKTPTQAPEIKKETARTGRRDEGHAQRSPLNHRTAAAVEIGGIKFPERRGVLNYADNKTLDINKDLLNPDLSYRWVNDDEKGRVSKMTDRDYQPVPEGSLGKDQPTRVRVGTQKNGSPLYAQLMATPKEWLKERRNAAEESRSAREKRVFAKPEDESGKELGSDFYNKGSKFR